MTIQLIAVQAVVRLQVNANQMAVMAISVLSVEQNLKHLIPNKEAGYKPLEFPHHKTLGKIL